MPATYWDTIQTRKGNGPRNLSEDQKNTMIERTVNTWDRMGLTDPQKAFGIAIMGVESGFDPHARAASTLQGGLGQFTAGAWRDAVDHYNNSWEPRVDAVRDRADPDAQIRVMGAWVPRIWQAAGDIGRDPILKGYNQKQIVYGKWKGGENKPAGDVGRYLRDNWHKSELGSYFDTTYDRAMQGLSRHISPVSQPRTKKALKRTSDLTPWPGAPPPPSVLI